MKIQLLQKMYMTDNHIHANKTGNTVAGVKCRKITDFQRHVYDYCTSFRLETKANFDFLHLLFCITPLLYRSTNKTLGVQEWARI